MRIVIIVLLIAVLALPLLGEWFPPQNFQALNGPPGWINLSWDAPPVIYEPETLMYDDGYADAFMDMDSGYYSVRFTPEGRCSVLAIQADFYVLVTSPRPVRFHFWGMDPYGLPDCFPPTTELASPIDIMVESGDTTIDVSSRGIVFDGSFDFYVGVEKEDTIPEMFISVDDSVEGEVRSYRSGGVALGHYETPGDILIRLVVMYTDTRTVTTLYSTPGKHVSPIIRAPELPVCKAVRAPDYIRERPSLTPTEAVEPENYTIYRTSTFSDPLFLGSFVTVDADTHMYSDHSVVSGRNYYYTVSANYPGGHSAFSCTTWATPYDEDMEITYDTLLFDDNVPDAGVRYEDAILANRFHVDSRCKLLGMYVHINTIGGGIPMVFDDYMGRPGEVLDDYDSTLITWYTTTPPWKYINLAPRRIYLEGDFFAGIQMDGYLGISLDSDYPGHAWDKSPGGVWSEVSDTTYYIRLLVQYSTGSAYYPIVEGWNALSLPIIPDVGMKPDSIFPFAWGVYGWNSDLQSWYEPEFMEPGKGYYILSSVDTFFGVDGTPIHDYTLPYAGPGFEFIGGLSDFGGIDTTRVDTDPATLWQPRHLYYWDAALSTWANKYKIKPSEAYFILLNGEGLFEAHE